MQKLQEIVDVVYCSTSELICESNTFSLIFQLQLALFCGAIAQVLHGWAFGLESMADGKGVGFQRGSGFDVPMGYRLHQHLPHDCSERKDV